jgi:uncharacterized protein (TIGR02996 family)
MTPDELALLAAVLASPGDDTPRLVYADWLDEHGRPERAEVVCPGCEGTGAKGCGCGGTDCGIGCPDCGGEFQRRGKSGTGRVPNPDPPPPTAQPVREVVLTDFASLRLEDVREMFAVIGDPGGFTTPRHPGITFRPPR